MLTGQELAIAVAEKLAEIDDANGMDWIFIISMIKQKGFDANIYIKKAAADLLPRYAERVDDQLRHKPYWYTTDIGHLNWWRNYTHEKFLNVWLELEENTDG